MLNIKNELLVFFCACLTGVNVRAGYEILIFLRKMIIHNNLVKGIEDLFYWIFMSAYIFSQIYATTYGSIRWYFLLGLVFGVAIIQQLISSGAKIHKKTRKNLEIIRKNRKNVDNWEVYREDSVSEGRIDFPVTLRVYYFRVNFRWQRKKE